MIADNQAAAFARVPEINDAHPWWREAQAIAGRWFWRRRRGRRMAFACGLKAANSRTVGLYPRSATLGCTAGESCCLPNRANPEGLGSPADSSWAFWGLLLIGVDEFGGSIGLQPSVQCTLVRRLVIYVKSAIPVYRIYHGWCQSLLGQDADLPIKRFVCSFICLIVISLVGGAAAGMQLRMKP